MSQESIIKRKTEHLDICSDDSPAFRHKSTGFENYDFRHFALTEVDLTRIDLSRKFFGFKSSFPFLISCMTGGTDEANNINLKLAETAASLNIPLGLGSLRYAIGTNGFDAQLSAIREKAGSVPVLGNLGAAQILGSDRVETVNSLIKKSGADVFVIHLNPLQELLQSGGEYNFRGLLKSIKDLVSEAKIPIIVKEVGSGIDGVTAKKLLKAGVSGIDTAGAGGTSWAGVEILRNSKSGNSDFWDWGIPTSICISETVSLKKDYDFTLIASGGINDPFTAAKALALGADFVASARIILHALNKNGSQGVVKLIREWFETVKRIMFLTGAQTLKEFDKKILIQTQK